MARPPRLGRGATAKTAPTVITNAHTGSSRELRSREKRYAITMAFRTACFIGMIFVPGPLRWVLFGAAVFLPYVAVLFANQANERGTYSAIAPGAPVDAPQLTTGPEPEVIAGGVVPDRDHRDGEGDGAREERVA